MNIHPLLGDYSNNSPYCLAAGINPRASFTQRLADPLEPEWIPQLSYRSTQPGARDTILLRIR